MAQTWSVPARGVGQPDYSAPKPVGQVPVGPVYTLTDLAELAARIGSINTHDRRGNVIAYDDFESPILKFETTVSGAGAGGKCVHSSAGARSGGQSALLRTGNALDDTVLMSRRYPYSVPSKFGIEISFAICTEWVATPGLAELILRVELLDTVNLYKFYAKYYHAPGSTPGLSGPYVRDSAGVWYQLGQPLLGEGNFEFHILKLVVDSQTYQYVRLILDNTEYDLSSYSAQVAVVPAQAPEIFVEYSLVNKGPRV